MTGSNCSTCRVGRRSATCAEYLNNDLKGQINAQGLPDSKEELRSRIQRFMRGLLNFPEHVMSYFRHPCTQYAAGS